VTKYSCAIAGSDVLLTPATLTIGEYSCMTERDLVYRLCIDVSSIVSLSLSYQVHTDQIENESQEKIPVESAVNQLFEKVVESALQHLLRFGS